ATESVGVLAQRSVEVDRDPSWLRRRVGSSLQHPHGMTGTVQRRAQQIGHAGVGYQVIYRTAALAMQHCRQQHACIGDDVATWLDDQPRTVAPGEVQQRRSEVGEW